MDVRLAIKDKDFAHPGVQRLTKGTTGSSLLNFPPYIYIAGCSDPDSQFKPRSGTRVSTIFISYPGDQHG